MIFIPNITLATPMSFIPCSLTRSTHCFNLIHVNIWGPFSIPSRNGSRFFLTIIDDYSLFTLVYLMKNKSKTFHMLTHFFNQINRQFSIKISQIQYGNDGIFLPQLQIVCFDNRSEFISQQLQSWFHENGIEHQRSCIATPRQIGVIEHKHRHLLDVA